MDSNRKFMNFKELLLTEEEETNPVVISCGNIKRAEEILKTNQIDSPHQIILHIGINNIDTQDTSDIAVKIATLAEAYKPDLIARFLFQKWRPEEIKITVMLIPLIKS